LDEPHTALGNGALLAIQVTERPKTKGGSMSTIRWWLVAAIALAVATSGSLPAGFAAVTVALVAWALMSFLHWRRLLRLRHGGGPPGLSARIQPDA
jgi:hypothetical protein